MGWYARNVDNTFRLLVDLLNYLLFLPVILSILLLQYNIDTKGD